jgi:hypothetical protein
MANETRVDLTEVADVVKRLNEVAKDMTLSKRRAILRRAAGPVRQRSISLAPRSKRVHYRYSTPKIIKGRRAKRGTATAYRIAYHPGNLKKSLQVLTFNRDRAGVYVGPKFGKGDGKDRGRTVKTADGYYAQMVYGSAAAFGGRITEAALSSVKRQVTAIIEDGIKKIVNATKVKNRL